MTDKPTDPALNAVHWCGLERDDLAALGLVMVHFGRVESELSFVVWSLLADANALAPHRCDRPQDDQHQSTGAVVTAALPFRRMVDVAVGLAIDRFDRGHRIVEILQDIARRCAIAEEDRNRMVHSWWPWTAQKSGADVVGRFKYGLNRQTGLVVSQDFAVDRGALLELAERLDLLSHDLMVFREETWPAVGPLSAD